MSGESRGRRRRALLATLSAVAAVAAVAPTTVVGAAMWREACAERVTVALRPADRAGEPPRLVARWGRRQGDALWYQMLFVDGVVDADGRPIAFEGRDLAVVADGGIAGRLAGRRAQRVTTRLAASAATQAAYPLTVALHIQDGWDETYLLARIPGPDVEVEALPDTTRR